MSVSLYWRTKNPVVELLYIGTLEEPVASITEMISGGYSAEFDLGKGYRGSTVVETQKDAVATLERIVRKWFARALCEDSPKGAGYRPTFD